MEQKEQHIVWHDYVVMKQFISYAVGCMRVATAFTRRGRTLLTRTPLPSERRQHVKLR